MNGMPILAALPSIRLDRSFPIEFMHLVWLNLIPNLVLLYTGNYKNLDAGIGEYELLERVWEEIGRITARAGSNIPNAFGARVPDPAKDKSHMIAETWCLWTMFIAPVVLRGRFVDDKYYDHFMQLVGLLELCLKLELTQDDIDKIRSGFIDWVQTYEEYFYQNDPKRLSTCVSTVHGLLHIADSIEAMGPVGCYWSFLMERYCSSLRPVIRSRRFPYTGIANHVVDSLYLRQIRLTYDTDKFFDRRQSEDVTAAVGSREYATPAYPSTVLMGPSSTYELSGPERRKIARHLSVRFNNANAKALEQYVPTAIEAWGKVRRLDGGDTIHAREMVKRRHDERDATFVRYIGEVDKHAAQRNRAPEYVQKAFFGQLQHVFVLSLPALPNYKQRERQTVLLASVKDCTGAADTHGNGIQYYSGALGPSHSIDLAAIECLVGRVEDRGEWAIVDRSNALTRVLVPNDEEDAE
ncbi:hypothetical protein EXIGLDRAFT_847001 [Exidia glandulosa HHB12029]|uniref:Uncharacterized protein n=1 Tax=Exidia glandulosa HHB12029 TaxID=1314781 RepID=A0A166NAX6_EXIGL|nr:hypothetical protein EXIGLDRAFT_847001 [Exidia glandulosa HHB12029]